MLSNYALIGRHARIRTGDLYHVKERCLQVIQALKRKNWNPTTQTINSLHDFARQSRASIQECSA